MNSVLKSVSVLKMERSSLFLRKTVIEVTDFSHTTGIVSARTSIIQHQLTKINDGEIRKPARFNCIPLLWNWSNQTLPSGAIKYKGSGSRDYTTSMEMQI